MKIFDNYSILVLIYDKISKIKIIKEIKMKEEDKISSIYESFENFKELCF